MTCKETRNCNKSFLIIYQKEVFHSDESDTVMFTEYLITEKDEVVTSTKRFSQKLPFMSRNTCILQF